MLNAQSQTIVAKIAREKIIDHYTARREMIRKIYENAGAFPTKTEGEAMKAAWRLTCEIWDVKQMDDQQVIAYYQRKVKVFQARKATEEANQKVNEIRQAVA